MQLSGLVCVGVGFRSHLLRITSAKIRERKITAAVWDIIEAVFLECLVETGNFMSRFV